MFLIIFLVCEEFKIYGFANIPSDTFKLLLVVMSLVTRTPHLHGVYRKIESGVHGVFFPHKQQNLG